MSRNHRGFGLALCGLAMGMCLAWPRSSQAEDLLQIYALARAGDPVLSSSYAARGVQSEQVLQARAGLLPQWSATLESTRAQRDGSQVQSASSRLSQVLLDLSQLRRWDAAQSALSAQDARVRAAEQALCARVASAYFAVLTAQASLRTASANEAAFGEQVRQAQSRFAAGLSAQVDVDQARSYHALAQGSTVQAREQLADARQGLLELSGLAVGPLQALLNPLPVAAVAVAPAQEAQAWVDQALQANPQLQALRLSLQASEQGIAAASAAHLPTLSAGLDSEQRRGSGVQDGSAGRSLNTVALRLSIPLFAGGATESLKRQAAYQRDAARDALEQARRALLRETRAQYQAVQSGLALMQSTASAVDAASQALASTRAGQALGTRSMTDLLLAIQTQASAQNAHEQARHRYVLSTLLLQQAAGTLGEGELAAVNQLLQAPMQPQLQPQTPPLSVPSTQGDS